jgi:predicted PurR-regulated permease PerM
MPQTIVLQITVKGIVLLLAALVVIWLLTNFSTILFILFLAILLAVAITPPVERMEEQLPRSLAILVVYVLLLGIVSAAVGLLVPLLADQINQLSQSLPQITQNVLDLPKRWVVPYFPGLEGTANNLPQELSTEVGTVAGSVGGLLVSLGRTLTTIIINTLIILVVAFFLTADAQFAPHFIARFFPPRYRPAASGLAREIGGRLGHWVRAQLLIGLFFGVAFGLGLAVLGVPYAFSLGVAGAVLELIPYIGGAIVTIMAMLVALPISPWIALGVLVLEVVVANIESHVIYPKLVGDIVGLHPLVIIIALFIGAEVGGVLGALLGVPVAVVLEVLFDHFYRFEEATAAEPTRTPTARRTLIAAPKITPPRIEPRN